MFMNRSLKMLGSIFIVDCKDLRITLRIKSAEYFYCKFKLFSFLDSSATSLVLTRTDKKLLNCLEFVAR